MSNLIFYIYISESLFNLSQSLCISLCLFNFSPLYMLIFKKQHLFIFLFLYLCRFYLFLFISHSQSILLSLNTVCLYLYNISFSIHLNLNPIFLYVYIALSFFTSTEYLSNLFLTLHPSIYDDL